MRPFDEAVEKAKEIKRQSRGRNPRYQRIEPPQAVTAQPGHINPVPILGDSPIPNRPLPPIAVGSDTVKQFEHQQAGLPKRRTFSPTPL